MKYIIVLSLLAHVIQVLFFNPTISQSAGMVVLAVGYVGYWLSTMGYDIWE